MLLLLFNLWAGLLLMNLWTVLLTCLPCELDSLLIEPVSFYSGQSKPFELSPGLISLWAVHETCDTCELVFWPVKTMDFTGQHAGWSTHMWLQSRLLEVSLVCWSDTCTAEERLTHLVFLCQVPWQIQWATFWFFRFLLCPMPNSWTYNFVEVSGHNVKSFKTWCFRMQC